MMSGSHLRYNALSLQRKFTNVKKQYSLLYKITCVLMAVIFFFAATPHDFIHNEFVSHKDTVDGIHKHAGVSKVHIHCEFLRISLSSTLPGHQVAVSLHATTYPVCFESLVLFSPFQVVSHYYLRGPPTIC